MNVVENPEVSVVVPCRNEREGIVAVLQDLAGQDFPGNYEVIVADGDSNDGTWEQLQRRRAEERYPYTLVLLRNPRRGIARAMNLMVAHARGQHIIRVDAHCSVGSDYVRTLVEALKTPGRDVVGPTVVHVASADTLTGRVIAAVLNHRLGNGGMPSRNRLRVPLKVDHTVMSCYHRRVWEAMGGYDESLLTNEDFDFDYRASRAGLGVYSLPAPVYYAYSRSTLRGLLAQRWRYGFWKGRVIRKHPRSLKFRQLVPMLALPLALATVALPPTFVALILSYLILVGVAAGSRSVRTEKSGRGSWLRVYALTFMAMVVVHFVWAAGLWWGLLRRLPPSSKVEGERMTWRKAVR